MKLFTLKALPVALLTLAAWLPTAQAAKPAELLAEYTAKGRNALSEKSIEPLAPAFNPARFTDRSKVDGWFKNNCKDVLGRDCTVAEKADILSWLLTFKP